MGISSDIFIWSACELCRPYLDLNNRYTAQEAKDGEFGRESKNGSWTGMVGMVSRKVSQLSSTEMCSVCLNVNASNHKSVNQSMNCNCSITWSSFVVGSGHSHSTALSNIFSLPSIWFFSTYRKWSNRDCDSGAQEERWTFCFLNPFWIQGDIVHAKKQVTRFKLSSLAFLNFLGLDWSFICGRVASFHFLDVWEKRAMQLWRPFCDFIDRFLPLHLSNFDWSK